MFNFFIAQCFILLNNTNKYINVYKKAVRMKFPMVKISKCLVHRSKTRKKQYFFRRPECHNHLYTTVDDLNSLLRSTNPGDFSHSYFYTGSNASIFSISCLPKAAISADIKGKTTCQFHREITTKNRLQGAGQWYNC